MLPILTYGAEVWAAFERDTYKSWDLGLIEQVHLNFYKHILGDSRSTTNLGHAELGRRPIKLIIDLKILQFFKHCSKLSDDKMVKEALKADGDLYTKHDTMKLFSKYISDTETVFHNNFRQLPKGKQKAKLLEMYQRIWKSKVVRSSKAQLILSSRKLLRTNLAYHSLDAGNTESVIQNSG